LGQRKWKRDITLIGTEKVEKGEDILEANHRGVTSQGTQKRLLVTRFDIDMTEANREKPCIPAKLTENSDLYDLCTVQGNSDKT